MRINHNIAALNTHRQLGANQSASGKNLEKLSSGLKINRAGDDAAGLAISEKMRAQIRGLDMASKNAQDSISLIQTAEGAMNETHSILQRMRELAVQSANDTNTTEDREKLQSEINELTSEINRIGKTTQFNNKDLLKGDFDYKAATGSSITGTTAIAGFTLTDTVEVFAGVKAEDVAAVRIEDTASILTGGVTVAGTDAMDDDWDELTIKIGTGAAKTITVDATGDLDKAITDLNGQLAGDNVAASIVNGKLVLESTAKGTTAPSISVLGGGFADKFISTNANPSSFVQGQKDALMIGAATPATSTGSTAVTAYSPTVTTNELTLSVDGSSHTVALNVPGTAYDLTDLTDQTTFLADLNAKLATKGANVIASFDTSNNLVLTGGTGVKDVSVTGGNAVTGLGLATTTDVTAGADNSAIVINGESYTLTNGAYKDLDAVITELNSKISGDGLVASVDAGKVKVASTLSTTAAVTVTGTGELAKQLGLDDVTATGHEAAVIADNSFDLTVNGKDATITFDKGTAYTQAQIKDAIATQLTAQGATDFEVAIKDNKLQITSTLTGTASGIEVEDSDALAAQLGLEGLSATGKAAENELLTFQIGSNQNQTMALSIADMRAESLGITGSGTGFSGTSNVTDGTNNEFVESSLDITTSTGAANAISVFDKAINSVSAERSKLGAVQNRLEHTINNLGTSSENLTAAESRIRDVDMAKEMMEFTKNNILSQAAQAMLAQANQQPQGVLQLLG
ncbi:hypothetical protein BK133_20950 [Paenibacillus sp. FSL H8-0548]|uniref:flagellin N-terminal helical domain-containing protein n=1 Tax=Paenibacillus sp. FSL H8-0548 TaxID=1920422 RepID=UPI00096DC25E|nr:flagellin [Paenibacillus sp. FSL H8-0548]OMF25792.1 hypothetical protein BK133_20950 [Paenibacillus sp. FSL H8-0548]